MDKSDCFYGIIKGKVSIRGYTYSKYKPPSLDEDYELGQDFETMMINYESSMNEKGNLTENQLRFNLEYEKTVFYPGMCFGEWGIIYNMKRTASSYCLEDTDVFYLTKEHFQEVLALSFFNSVSSKKKFLNNIIPGLGTQLSFVVPLFFDYGDIIYSPKNVANKLYIVYQGECAFGDLKYENINEDYKVKNMNKFVILSKGSLGGMESVIYYKKKRVHYNHTCIANQDYTVVYEINVELIYRQGLFLLDYIKPLYDAQNEIHQNYLEKMNSKIPFCKLSEEKKHKKIKSYIPINEKKAEELIENIKTEVSENFISNILHNSSHPQCVTCNSDNLQNNFFSKKLNCGKAKFIRKGFLKLIDPEFKSRKLKLFLNRGDLKQIEVNTNRVNSLSPHQNTKNTCNNTFMTSNLTSTSSYKSSTKLSYSKTVFKHKSSNSVIPINKFPNLVTSPILRTPTNEKIKERRIIKDLTSKVIKDKYILTTLQRFKIGSSTSKELRKKYNSGYYEIPMYHSLSNIEK